MKKREIRHEIKLAMNYLPSHVRQYVEANVRIDISRIYNVKAGKTDKSFSMYGCYGLEPCENCGEDHPVITIDERIEGKVKRIFLHECGHAWLARNNRHHNKERTCHLLAQLWLMRGAKVCNDMITAPARADKSARLHTLS